MNFNKNHEETACLYETPAVNVIIACTEGMLCASAGVGIEEWVNDDDPLAI